ncbi:AsmA-like C-terminal region-containing protein [Rhodoblastus sp. 17X3]|uniref:AsmA-like C-terminal region-containing protein n=1 Tax=Rhodoblastus sp. 17X3 TaxID=3047026 RepID=UPI0024B7F2BE|nr:AsmA-like C-terminal region-containing protein [Rhodoblastus sp. 17X3]MDI9847251.1 AsmA-like C-terminal region-containing protein [Rhodoblastus sp. 17X3]
MTVLCVLGIVVAALAFGRVSLDVFKPVLVSALQQRLGPAYALEIEGIGVERQDRGLALAVTGVKLNRADGHRLISAPKADLIFDPLSLLAGQIKPSRVDIDGLNVELRVLPDGGLDLSAGGEPSSLTPPTAPDAAPNAPADASAATPQPSVAPPTSGEVHVERARVLRQAAKAINAIFDLGQGRDSPIATLDHFGIRRGRLIVDDREAGQKRGFEEFEFSLDRAVASHRPVVDVKISARGPSGRWSVEGVARGGRDEAHELAIDGSGFSIDEIALLAGKTSLPIDSDIPISFKASASFRGDGHVFDANARLALGQGFWRFDDPDFPPVFLDEFFAAAHWDAANHRAVVDQAQIFSGASRCFLNGVIAPPSQDAAPWSISFKQAEACVIGPDRAGEKPVTIATIRVDLALDPPNKILSLNRIELVGPEVAAAVQGSVDWVEGAHMRLGVSAGKMTAAGVLAVWPHAFGAPVRGWAGDHLLSGTLENFRLAVDLDDLDLRMMRAQIPPMNDRVAMDYTVRDVAFTFLDGAPAVQGMNAQGVSTGRSARMDASVAFMEAAPGRRIDLTDGRMTMPDFKARPMQLIVGAHGRGSLDVLGEILAMPGFAKVASLPLDPKTTKGQFDGEFTYRTALQEVYDPKLSSMEVKARVESFAADRLIGKAGLEQGSLSVSLLGGVTHITGTGKLFGAPATLEFTRSDDQPAKGTISFPMDEAARAKAGLNFGSSVVGPVGVKIVGDVGAAHPQAQVELDLARTGLIYPVPGLFKPAGRPAKSTFFYREDERGGATLDDFIYDGSGQSARGMLQLSPEGALAAAKLPQLKFSPGDNLQVDAQKSGETMKITARGAAVDARPFLSSLTDSSPSRGPTTDFDLDLNTTLLTGANRQIISNAAMRLAKKGGQFQALNISGNFGADPVKGVLTRPDSGPPLFTLNTSDGGALLAFLDFYTHMEGGAFAAELRLADGGFSGSVDVENFVLRGEPALKSFADAPNAEALASKVKLNPNAVSFTRMHAMLQKSNGRLVVRDGAIANPSIGSTLEGWIDFDKDTLDVSGTFVPAYGVNNLFGQLPVIGMVLGGGQEEGLIGVNFRVSGKTASPVLSVNPLSAIAPGFLRKIFGILPH